MIEHPDFHSPWKVKSTLPPPLRRAEAIRQRDATKILLGTSLPGPLQYGLKAFFEGLEHELTGENDNEG